jgi:hypothetical protein
MYQICKCQNKGVYVSGVVFAVFGLTVTTPSLTLFLFLMIIPPAFLDALLGILAQLAERSGLLDSII